MTHQANTEHERHVRDPEAAPDTAESARRARFGSLPERVRPEDVVETRTALPRDPARDAYNPDEWLVRYCL
ncbi:hypothetical protein ACGFT2_04630 [Streptomyces sp. NPDC048514]|uniref:hypothetical protein n=1 Tax=Streptomyces sp. NPDC048514 TaxID=3365564 RepID=UPI00371C60AC